MIFDKMIFH